MEPTTHPFDREEVMAYLDGELGPDRASAAAAHLEQCAECRALAASLRSLSTQLPQWDVESVPAAVEQHVLRALAEKSAADNKPQIERTAPARPHVRWLMWGSAIGATALLLLVVSTTIPRRWSPQPLVVDDRPGSFQTAAPSAPPMGGKQKTLDAYGRYDLDARSKMARENAAVATNSLGKLRDDRTAQPGAQYAPSAPSPTGPMIVRTASLALLTKEFDAARAALENLVKAHQGYFGELNVAAPASQGRSLAATVRVPAAQLDPVLVELRKLGRVEQENQSADEVTRHYVDLTARLANARETEKRLVEILRERTGKVGDVLAVEREIARTREQIEQMDAQRKNLDSQVQYASVDLRIIEEYKQSLEKPAPAPSLGTRLNNAAIAGLRDAWDLVLGMVLWLLGAVPTFAVVAAILSWPVLRLVRWIRRRFFAATPVATA